jgi:hypothetical protein
MTAHAQPRARAQHADTTGPPDATPRTTRLPSIGSRMVVSRIIGGLFLLGFLTYGPGSMLMTSVSGGEAFLPGVPTRQTVLVFGALLMLLVTAIDIGKAILFFPIVDRYGRRTALAYLATMIFEVAMMAVGILALLLLVPLADQAASGALDAGVAQSLASLAVDANQLAYQIAQMSLGFGAMFLCALLLRSGLVPRALAILGLAGYALHMVGAICELFGLHISLFMLIPGGIFEIAVAIWLLVKGFKPAAYAPA